MFYEGLQAYFAPILTLIIFIFIVVHNSLEPRWIRKLFIYESILLFILLMAQLGEEAFSNPEVIDNSIAFMNKYSLFRNEMLNDFKIVNIYPLVWTHSLGALSRQLHPSTDGKAVQRGNVYTYQTSDYTLSTNQAYQPGEYGDQQQIELATLSNNVSVFSLQPMRNSTRENYWVGQGRMPYSVQEKNINVSLFTIPSKAGLLEPHAMMAHQNPDGSFNTLLCRKSYRELSATALFAAGAYQGLNEGILPQGGAEEEAAQKAAEAVFKSLRKNKKGHWEFPEISGPTCPLPPFPGLNYKLIPRKANWSYGLAALIFLAVQKDAYEKLRPAKCQ